MRRPREQHSSFRFRFTSMESRLSKRTIESEYCLVIVTHRAPRPPPREFTNSAPTLFFKPRFPWTPCPPPDTLSMLSSTTVGYTLTYLPIGVCGLSVKHNTSGTKDSRSAKYQQHI